MCMKLHKISPAVMSKKNNQIYFKEKPVIEKNKCWNLCY